MTLADPNRPDPDALLARAAREGRGRLKVFLGASPGVGKTYAMLAAAREAKGSGRDVVVGLVETHGRKETEALLAGLEVLPRKLVVYRNRAVMEFDVDAAIARRPSLLLVDEYAHTNVPGSRHPKRWQDVAELVAAGIDVWTTLNVQHLESLNDVVQKITKVRVRETVPDTAFEAADEVVMVDLTPEELLKRLSEGKVYVQETARRAVEHFFKPQHLAALRELALRRTAEQVDADLVERMQAGAIEGPWAAGERILACVGPDDLSPHVVRQAKRLADLMDAPWSVATVERPTRSVPDATRERIDSTLRLAVELGATVERLVGDDIPAEILRHARRENVTRIVVGRADTGLWSIIRRRSLPHELVRTTQDIVIEVVSRGAANAPAPPVRKLPTASRRLFREIGWSTVGVAAVVAAGSAVSEIATLPNISMAFLAAVLFSAISFGLWPAVATSILSFLAYNFFFIEPRFTFTVGEPHELFALGVFLVVAGATSALAGRVREQARVASDRMKATRRLYEFTTRLSALATLDDVAEGAASEIHASIGREALVMLSQAGDLAVIGRWPPGDDLDTASLTAARWTAEKREPAGFGTGTLPLVPWLFLPLAVGDRTGVVGVAMPSPLDSEARGLLDTLAGQTAAALERAALGREIGTAKAAAEAERVRNTLLASISHDFRTPIASILGAATTLRDFSSRLPESTRADLLAQIREEAEHLDTMVRDLLAITRLEAGALELRTDWIDLGEVVRRTADTARRRAPDRLIEASVAPGNPLVKADATLLGQALANIIENAMTHGGPDASVQLAVEGDDPMRLIVTDDGPGIPPDALPYIFDKFWSTRPRDARDGLMHAGLGLAIAKGIIEAHGGTIAAESPITGGRGTRIIISLPGGQPR